MVVPSLRRCSCLSASAIHFRQLCLQVCVWLLWAASPFSYFGSHVCHSARKLSDTARDRHAVRQTGTERTKECLYGQGN
jgi:hypothetical protein